MTEQEAVNFIHGRSWLGSVPGLSRTRRLLALMGNPEKGLRFIHVAGTNGKGSVSAMLSGVLTAAGYKTGFYTSPFITRFNERIQIGGVPIPGDALAKETERAAPLILSMEDDPPTEFELVTAVAMAYFARENCDFVVLETGLGGRLDSTNVIEAPLLSIITNIGLDHTKELGDTAEQIAAEKAGIIKKGRPVAVYDLPESVKAVIGKKCAETSSGMHAADFGRIISLSDDRSGQVFSYKGFSALFLPLLGTHQLKNAAVVLEAVALLRGMNVDLSDSAVRRGFEKTRWPARFELISDNPFFVVDGGHNPQCAEAVAENLLRYFPESKRVLLFGVLADKDYVGMAKALAQAADIFVTIAPPGPRALPADKLAAGISFLGRPVFSCNTVEEGIEKALSLAGEKGVVCSVGSLYSAGTVRAYFGRSI